MIELNRAAVKKLLETTDLTALVGQRINANIADQSNDYPYVVLSYSGGKRPCKDLLSESSVEMTVEVWSKSYELMLQVAGIIESALCGKTLRDNVYRFDFEGAEYDVDKIDGEQGTQMKAMSIRVSINKNY